MLASVRVGEDDDLTGVALGRHVDLKNRDTVTVVTAQKELFQA